MIIMKFMIIFLMSFSLKISGIRSAIAIYMKLPAAKGSK